MPDRGLLTDRTYEHPNISIPLRAGAEITVHVASCVHSDTIAASLHDTVTVNTIDI